MNADCEYLFLNLVKTKTKSGAIAWKFRLMIISFVCKSFACQAAASIHSFYLNAIQLNSKGRLSATEKTLK